MRSAAYLRATDSLGKPQVTQCQPGNPVICERLDNIEKVLADLLRRLDRAEHIMRAGLGANVDGLE